LVAITSHAFIREFQLNTLAVEIRVSYAATDTQQGMTRKRSFGSNGVKNEKVNYSFNIVVLNGICRSVRVLRIAIYRGFH
jgi:hypothetical protein